MSFAKMGQDEKHRSPNSNEEYNNENKNLIFGNGYTPKVCPVTSVGLGVHHDQAIDLYKERKGYKPRSTNNYEELQRLRTKRRAFVSITFLGSEVFSVVFVGSNLSRNSAFKSSHQ
jgi:hypothetical protein